MKNNIGIITIGSYESKEIILTIEKSYKLINLIANDWIFILMNAYEVEDFKIFKKNNPWFFSNLNIKIDCCDDGISASMNKGLKISNNNWTLMLHSGDYLIENISEHKILNFIAKNKNYDVIVFGTKYVNDKKIVGRSNHLNSFFKLPYEFSIPHQSTFISRKLYDLQLYANDIASSMDYDFFVRAKINKAKFKFINYYITAFSLGGKSSNIYFSYIDLKKSLKRNLKKSFKRFYLINFNLKFILIKKYIFKCFYYLKRLL